MFLLRMEAGGHLDLHRFYEFVPYNYGPFDSTIYRDVEILEAVGLLREQPRGNYSRYVATQAGHDQARGLEEGEARGEARDYLINLIGWILSVDFTQLLRSVYAKYPDYAVNSVFKR